MTKIYVYEKRQPDRQAVNKLSLKQNSSWKRVL